MDRQSNERVHVLQTLSRDFRRTYLLGLLAYSLSWMLQTLSRDFRRTYRQDNTDDHRRNDRLQTSSRDFRRTYPPYSLHLSVPTLITRFSSSSFIAINIAYIEAKRQSCSLLSRTHSLARGYASTLSSGASRKGPIHRSTVPLSVSSEGQDFWSYC
jgi:hypothetical protein